MNRTQENLEMSQEGFREEGIIRLPAWITFGLCHSPWSSLALKMPGAVSYLIPQKDGP